MYQKKGTFLVFVKDEMETHVDCKLPILAPREGKSLKGVRRIGVGTVWECNICHKQWKVTRASINDPKVWSLVPEAERLKPVDQTTEENFTKKK
jgi:hypothetical protein